MANTGILSHSELEELENQEPVTIEFNQKNTFYFVIVIKEYGSPVDTKQQCLDVMCN